MQLTCPNCQAVIAAENINIQQMTAVCAACDAVFQFDPPQAHQKRRKLKQPDNFELHESTDRLHMAFRTNFRLDKDDNFIGAAVLSVVFPFLTLLMLTGIFSGDDIPLLIPLMFTAVSLGAWYWLAVRLYNKTHIDADEYSIQVQRKPLPGAVNQSRMIDLGGVDAIHVEETQKSKSEGYDTPRYRIWAERQDRRQETIVTDIIEPYASFVAQRLQSHLEEVSEYDDFDIENLIEDITQDDLLLHAVAEAEEQTLNQH